MFRPSWTQHTHTHMPEKNGSLTNVRKCMGVMRREHESGQQIQRGKTWHNGCMTDLASNVCVCALVHVEFMESRTAWYRTSYAVVVSAGTGRSNGTGMLWIVHDYLLRSICDRLFGWLRLILSNSSARETYTKTVDNLMHLEINNDRSTRETRIFSHVCKAM